MASENSFSMYRSTIRSAARKVVEIELEYGIKAEVRKGHILQVRVSFGFDVRTIEMCSFPRLTSCPSFRAGRMSIGCDLLGISMETPIFQGFSRLKASRHT